MYYTCHFACEVLFLWCLSESLFLTLDACWVLEVQYTTGSQDLLFWYIQTKHDIGIELTDEYSNFNATEIMISLLRHSLWSLPICPMSSQHPPRLLRTIVSLASERYLKQTGVTCSNSLPLYPDTGPFLMWQTYPTLEL